MPDDVSAAEKTERFLRLDNLIRFHQQKVFRAYINQTVEVLAEKISEKHPNQISGHTSCQVVVNFEGAADLLGKIVKVRILESKANTLYGKIC
jgi:tRNA-2-methylthio-N6-dimethylallyladenosine synthase